jgi:hypothetical protein
MAWTTKDCRKSEIKLNLLYEQSCAFAFQDQWFAPPRCERRGESAKKKLATKIPYNPLIRLVSDERIQGNPRKSKG